MTLHSTRYAGLAATQRPGTDPAAPAFVLLHGLTFDRRMWDPILDLLPGAHRALAFDLPGHGGSEALKERGLAPVAESVHTAVTEAGVVAPIVVGHSIGGPIASIYASAHAAAGVVSVEAAGIPYVCLLANPVDSADRDWLAERVPAADVVVWPVEHHFPHLARPGLFASLLAEVARRSVPVSAVA